MPVETQAPIVHQVEVPVDDTTAELLQIGAAAAAGAALVVGGVYATRRLHVSGRTAAAHQ